MGVNINFLLPDFETLPKMELLQIYFRLNGHDYKGTALPVVEEGKAIRFIINVPGIREGLTLIPAETENAWIVWKDYDTNEESMLIEMIGKAIERAQ